MSNDIKKSIHHIHDKSYKDLYSKKEVAADLFKRLLKEEWAEELTADKLSFVTKSFVTADYEETECDVVYKATLNDVDIIFYILIEFQSTVDYRMPLRLLFYMCEILRDDAKNAKHSKHDRNLKIPAVIPIVLYNGSEIWDVPNEFRKIIYNENLFKSSLLNFTYDVVENVTSAIFLLDQKIDALEFLQRIKAIALFFDGLSKTEILAIKNWIRNTVSDQLAESAIKILEADRRDVESMVSSNAFILEEMKEEAEKRGLKIGIEEGIKQGIEQGEKNSRVHIAKNLLDILEDEIIAIKTGLSIEEVRNLRNQ